MPFSAAEGKTQIERWIRAIRPATVLDVGAGAGGYAVLLRGCAPQATVYATEVHEPYVAEFGLRDIYADVTVEDSRFRTDWGVDVVIFGDVLEHMTEPEAREVWSRALSQAGWLIASVPTSERYWHQDAENDNDHEAHLANWTYENLAALPGVVDSVRGQDVSVVLAEGEKDGPEAVPVPEV
jgi:trans-aconitate methyltransferase